MQEHRRTSETIEIWDNVASGPRNIHKLMPQQWQAQFGNMLFELKLEDPSERGQKILRSEQWQYLGRNSKLLRGARWLWTDFIEPKIF